MRPTLALNRDKIALGWRERKIKACKSASIRTVPVNSLLTIRWLGIHSDSARRLIEVAGLTPLWKEMVLMEKDFIGSRDNGQGIEKW